MLGDLPGLPRWPNGRESSCQCRRLRRRRFDPWVGAMHWRRTWQPTVVFFLENPVDRGAWQATVEGVAESEIVVVAVVQSPSRVWLFVTLWTTARQASRSSPSSRVCPSSCSCHPATASSDALFSFSPQSFPASETFPMSCLFASGDHQGTKMLELQLQHQQESGTSSN